MNRDDAMVFLRAILIALFVVVAGAAAFADDPKLPPGVTCSDVRANVAQYGEIAAYAWARLRGYSSKQISEAKKCLK